MALLGNSQTGQTIQYKQDFSAPFMAFFVFFHGQDPPSAKATLFIAL